MTTKSDGTDEPDTSQTEDEQSAPVEATVAMQMTPELLEELERRAKVHSEQQAEESSAPPEGLETSDADEDEDDEDEATAMLQMTPELLAKLREEVPAGDGDAVPAADAESAPEPDADEGVTPKEPALDVAYDTSELETLRAQEAAPTVDEVEAVTSYPMEDVVEDTPEEEEVEEATRMADAVDLTDTIGDNIGEEATMMASGEDVAAAIAAVQQIDPTEKVEAPSDPISAELPMAEPVSESVPVSPPPPPPPRTKAAAPGATIMGLPKGWVIAGAALAAIIVLVIFLPFSDPFGLYGGDEEKEKAETAGSSAPATTQNQGTSTTSLAGSHLPGGFDVYVGVSTSGILNASLLNDVLDEDEQDNLISELESKAKEVKTMVGAEDIGVDDIEAVTVAIGQNDERKAYGAIQFSSDVDLEALDGGLGEVDGVRTETWGEVEQVYVHGDAQVAAYTSDNGVLVGGALSTVKTVLEGDDDEHPGNFKQDEKVSEIAEHLDLDATAWVIVAPEDVAGMLPDGAMDAVPIDVTDGLMGAGVAVHVDKDIFVQMALLFEESDQADAVWIALEALKENEVADKDGHGKGQLQKLLDESEKGSDQEKMIQLLHADLYRAKFKVKGDVLAISFSVSGELVQLAKGSFTDGER